MLAYMHLVVGNTPWLPPDLAYLLVGETMVDSKYVWSTEEHEMFESQ